MRQKCLDGWRRHVQIYFGPQNEARADRGTRIITFVEGVMVKKDFTTSKSSDFPIGTSET